MFGRVSDAEARKRLEPGEKHLEFKSFDLHVIATRNGGIALSATLPNGHRTTPYLVTQFWREKLFELLNLIKLYDRRQDTYQASLQRDRAYSRATIESNGDKRGNVVEMAQDEAVARGYDPSAPEGAGTP